MDGARVRRIWSSAAVLVAALAMATGSLAAQVGIVTGTVTDANSGEPIATVQVHIPELQLGMLTTWREVESKWEPFYNAVGELETESITETADMDYTVLVDWYPPAPSGSFAIRLEYVFNENTDEFNPGVVDPTLPGFGDDRNLLNARIAWFSSDEAWTVALWGKNLLDDEVTSEIDDISTASFGTPFVSVDPPLTWGMELGYRF